MKIEIIKDLIEQIMLVDERTRDCDNWLVISTLNKLGFNIPLSFEEVKNTISFETITRCRRFIQNSENRLLPSREVQDKRKTRKETYTGLWRNSNLSF